MPLTFFPPTDELETSTLSEKLEVLLDSASRYKAAVLDAKEQASTPHTNGESKRLTPREIRFSFNWEEITKVLHEIRHYPEATPTNKAVKAENLAKLAEIYEVLRSAKMPKLEAVRIALVNEANQLRNAAA